MSNWVLFLATFATRLPFIWIGYGVHTDGWRVIRTVAVMLAGEEYLTSRPPGYPLPEAILTAVGFIFGDGPPVMNAVSAIYSAVAAVALSSCLAHARVPHAPWIALLTLCFPVLLIESTGAKEYLCALMFMLLSFRVLLGERPVIGGILLGLAVASRPSTAAFAANALAWLLLWHAPAWATALRRAASYGASAALTTVVAFLPLFLKYGTGLLEVVPTRPALLRVAYAASLGVFGLVGTLAIAALIVVALWSLVRRLVGGTAVASRDDAADEARRRRAHLGAAAVNVAVFAAVYLAMPNEGAYLIPAIPSLVTLLALAVPPRLALAGCALVASSSLLLSAYQRDGEVILDLAGSAVADQVERERLECIGRAAGAFAAGLGDDAYLIAAHRMPIVRAHTPPAQRLHVIDEIDARDGDRFRLGLDSDGIATPTRQRVNDVRADSRLFVLDEIAVYQPQVPGVAPQVVPVAAHCPVPRTALLRIPIDLRQREPSGLSVGARAASPPP
jgi:hypothetical protein